MQHKSHFLEVPHTRPGQLAAWLLLAFVVLFIADIVILSMIPDETIWQRSILPFYAPVMLLCGLASGIFSLNAMVRENEHSLLIWLSLLVCLFTLLLIANETMQAIQYFSGL